jgi:Icc-related predicted phosphoesterase
MRLYTVADIHGRPERLATVRRVLQAYRPAGVILAGDILGWRSRRNTLAALRQIPVPVLAVVCCGHIHQRPGSRRVGRTLVINCSMGWRGAGAIVDLEPGAPPRVTWADADR